jgi:hypothetical protein
MGHQPFPFAAIFPFSEKNNHQIPKEIGKKNWELF